MRRLVGAFIGIILAATFAGCVYILMGLEQWPTAPLIAACLIAAGVGFSVGGQR